MSAIVLQTCSKYNNLNTIPKCLMWKSFTFCCLRRGSSVMLPVQRRTASLESGGGHSAHGELYPEGSESSWISDAGSFSRQGGFNASNLAVHFEGDEIVEISDMSTGVLDSDPHMEHV